jgi:uncharacterized protein YndB with AHSA1/START domain
MKADDAAERRFSHSRLIDAPVEVVFSAFAEPHRLARWWGPDGFSSEFETFDLRPGGGWRFVMRGPDGAVYPNSNIFKTVEPPHRIVIEHIDVDHHFVLDITFAAHGGRTLVGWIALGAFASLSCTKSTCSIVVSGGSVLVRSIT